MKGGGKVGSRGNFNVKEVTRNSSRELQAFSKKKQFKLIAMFYKMALQKFVGYQTQKAIPPDVTIT